MTLCTSEKRRPRQTICPLFERVAAGLRYIAEVEKALTTADKISANIGEITTVLSYMGFKQEAQPPSIADIIGGRLTLIKSHSSPLNIGTRTYRAIYEYDLTKREYTIGIDEVTPEPSFGIRISVNDKRKFQSTDATGYILQIGNERIPEAAVTQEFSHLLESRPDLHRLFGAKFKELHPLRNLTLRTRILQVRKPAAPVPRPQGVLPRPKTPGLAPAK